MGLNYSNKDLNLNILIQHTSRQEYVNTFYLYQSFSFDLDFFHDLLFIFCNSYFHLERGEIYILASDFFKKTKIRI